MAERNNQTGIIYGRVKYMEFEFVLSKYNYESFIPQVSKALEKRTELISRKRYPKMWKYIDSLSSRDKAKEEKLKKRRKRYKVYGIFLILIGLFLLIPSLMKPEELLMPLFTGAFATGLGLLYFLYGRNRGKEKPTSFNKAAIKLFNEYEKIPSGEVKVTFTDDKVRLAEDVSIDYSEINNFFITEDLIIVIWREKITVLQKKDLATCNVEAFTDFITRKSQDLFEVVDLMPN